MEQMQNEKNYKTDEKCLLEEFIAAAEDCFNSSIVQGGNVAVVRLNSGQVFKLSLAEVV